MKIRDLSRARRSPRRVVRSLHREQRAPGCVTRSFAAPRRAPDSFRWLNPGCLRQAARPICAALVCARSYPAESFRRRLAPAAHRLKVSGALYSTELTDAEHRPRDWIFQAHRVRDQCPDVWMRLQDQRDTFHGSSVGAFAALGEALLQQSLGIRKQADALARGALTAKVVGKALAIRGLGKHSCQGELADSSRTSKEQGVRNASGAQSAAQGRYYAFI